MRLAAAEPAEPSAGDDSPGFETGFEVGFETFLDSITVSATRGDRTLAEVPASVSIVDATRIDELLMRDAADLVRYEPGVHAASGTSGFSIRGIGGNRVLTRIDGVPTLEEFEFGHFEVPRFALDPGNLRRVEILRGPASSLYGSDAIGGVVSLETKGPADLLGASAPHALALRAGWHGRDDELATHAHGALGRESWQGSLSSSVSQGGERENQGRMETLDASRTAPDPRDWRAAGLLAKITHQPSPRSELALALETFDRRVDTDALSARTTLDLGRILGLPPQLTYVTEKTSVTARDEQRRRRLSVEQSSTGGLVDHLLWRGWLQTGKTEQTTREHRETTTGGGALGDLQTLTLLREGLLDFEQESAGGEVQLRQALELGGPQLLTWGSSLTLDRFEQLRDRNETDLASGERVPSADGLHFPTRYFPASRVGRGSVWAQLELSPGGGRLTLVPALRYDRYRLDVDAGDAVYLAGNAGTEPPVDLREDALSPKLGLSLALGGGVTAHAQYASGFRAPPFSAVNSGFTHLAAGLTRLPNPDLAPETSDGLEFSLRGSWRRGSLSLTAFENRYEDFIELVALGFNPATRLIEFQHRNVAAARIRGLEATADAAISRRWSARASFASSDGEDRGRDQPLNSISPPQLVVGLRHQALDGRFSFEAASRWVGAKEGADLDRTALDQFAAPSYQLLDLYASFELTPGTTLDTGIFNLLDETYWEWTDALGRTALDPALDRVTAPGLHAAVALRHRR